MNDNQIIPLSMPNTIRMLNGWIKALQRYKVSIPVKIISSDPSQIAVHNLNQEDFEEDMQNEALIIEGEEE